MNWLDAVDRTVTGLGYELVDTERAGGGLLRVTIDRVPGRAYDTGAGDSITVDDCEKVTRQLQHVLEVENAAYERLEVSSPGLDRPLKREADFERFVGEKVALTLKQPLQGRKKFQGVLERADGPGQWCLVLEAASPVGAVSTAIRGRAKPKPKANATASTDANPDSTATEAPPADESRLKTLLRFALSEIREARLVPVLDFKGRRFTEAADPQTAAAPDAPPAGQPVADGGRYK